MFKGIQYMNNQSKPTQTKARRAKRPKPKSRNMKLKRNPLEKSTKSGEQSIPVAFSDKRVTGKPKQTHLTNGDAVVEHSEFIQDVPGTIAFSVLAGGLPVNPGMSNTFPWLNQLANNYESYLFEKLEFEYRTSSSSATSGVLMLAIDYDASDPAPVGKVQISSYQDCARDAPWKSFIQRNKLQNLRKRSSYYVRNGALSANQDIKLYDVGNVFMASQGMAADTPAVGELWVNYKIRLMTPQLQDPAVGTSRSSRIIYTGSTIDVNAGSNAPLVATGTATSSILTATQPYNCLISLLVTNTAPNIPALATVGTSCTLQNSQFQTTGTLGVGLASYQALFLTGQTLNIQNTGTAPLTAGYQIGQFNSAVL